MEEWKLGIFYFNPADPRVFVPKNSGLGLTLNFGRPESWVIAALFLLGLGAYIVLRSRREGDR